MQGTISAEKAGRSGLAEKSAEMGVPGFHVRELHILEPAATLRVGRILQERGGRPRDLEFDPLTFAQYLVGRRQLAREVRTLAPVTKGGEVRGNAVRGAPPSHG